MDPADWPLTVDAARVLYEDSDGGHDFDHVLRVSRMAEHIARMEGADLAVVAAAALLHDIGRDKGQEDHHLRSAQMAREILCDRPPAFVEAVVHAIEAHRFRAEPEPRTLEAQIVSDADKLDAIGAIGVARAFAHAGSRNSALWRVPWQEIAAVAGDANTQPATLGRDYTPVHEFVYKLDRIPNRLYTATARAIASRRHAFMRAFFEQLDAEVMGRS